MENFSSATTATKPSANSVIAGSRQHDEIIEIDEFDNLPWNAEAEAVFQRGLRECDLDTVPDTVFPVYKDDCLEDTDDANERLGSLMTMLRKDGEYSRIRDEYCILSILLNQQGRIAPAFRTKPQTGKRKGDAVFFDIHRDQLVIDCHWLYCKGLPIKTDDDEFRPMFQPETLFPFDLAWTFSNRHWKRKYRTDEILTLTPFQQCQLVTLRSDDVNARFAVALDGGRQAGKRVPAKISAVRLDLNMWAEKDRRIIPLRDDYEHLWLAQELIGENASIRQIAELSALMSGTKQRDDKTIRDKLKKMKRHIRGG